MRTGGGEIGANNDKCTRIPSKLRRAARHTLHAYHVAGVSGATGLSAAGARYKQGTLPQRLVQDTQKLSIAGRVPQSREAGESHRAQAS